MLLSAHPRAEYQKKASKYYQFFLNSMAKIVSRFGGFVIKNVGDCLLYYFPESSKSQRKFGFFSCIECCLSMAESHDTICEKLWQEGLPPVNYRISADYGSVIITKTKLANTNFEISIFLLKKSCIL